MRETLRSLGFSDDDMSLATTALSGGQKKLVGLCKLLVTRPALLLLDEPDNHLDLEAKAALEKTIVSYEGAVVIVSHDRYLLDAVADEIADLEDGQIKVYLGNYSEYAFEKRTALLRQQQRYSIQQREIKRIETAGKRVLQWGRQYDNPKLVRRGKAILARLDKIERIERPVLERRKMGLGAQRLARQQQGAGDWRTGKVVRRKLRTAWDELAGAARRARGAGRPERRGQVAPAAHDLGPGRTDGR